MGMIEDGLDAARTPEDMEAEAGMLLAASFRARMARGEPDDAHEARHVRAAMEAGDSDGEEPGACRLMLADKRVERLRAALEKVKASLQREVDAQRATGNAPYYANGVVYALIVIDKHLSAALDAEEGSR